VQGTPSPPDKAVAAEEVLRTLRALGSPRNVEGMARFGISVRGTLGVSMPVLRGLAKEHRHDHSLAQKLWDSGIHEARIMASLVDNPALVTSSQMDLWVRDVDSWDICDQCCANLFALTSFAWAKALRWSRYRRTYTKRAGFALMACLAQTKYKAADSAFAPFFACIEAEADDDRPMVKKAVNWALRQIGKRNTTLYKRALSLAVRLSKSSVPSSRWIGSDAVRELSGKTANAMVERHERILRRSARL
jgi:3-methyladenine DNA glycosylase AlkD